MPDKLLTCQAALMDSAHARQTTDVPGRAHGLNAC